MPPPARRRATPAASTPSSTPSTPASPAALNRLIKTPPLLASATYEATVILRQLLDTFAAAGKANVKATTSQSNKSAPSVSSMRFASRGIKMEATRREQVIVKDGELQMSGLPYKRGEVVEVIILPQESQRGNRSRLTVGELRRSGLFGLWKDRDDIQDSAAFARQLREQAQPETLSIYP